MNEKGSFEEKPRSSKYIQGNHSFLKHRRILVAGKKLSDSMSIKPGRSLYASFLLILYSSHKGVLNASVAPAEQTPFSSAQIP